LFQTLITKDTYVAATILVIMAAILIIGNIVSDLLLAWVDPRTRVLG
jgi:peptide/nickel transport system permease protein